MCKKQKDILKSMLSVRCFDFSDVSELTIQPSVFISKLCTAEFAKCFWSVVGMYSKGAFLLGHHLFLYRLVSARLSGTSGAVYTYYWHDSLSPEIALGLNSQNQGTDILSEVLEMGCLSAVLFFHPSIMKSFLHSSVLHRLVLAREAQLGITEIL